MRQTPCTAARTGGCWVLCQRGPRLHCCASGLCVLLTPAGLPESNTRRGLAAPRRAPPRRAPPLSPCALRLLMWAPACCAHNRLRAASAGRCAVAAAHIRANGKSSHFTAALAPAATLGTVSALRLKSVRACDPTGRPASTAHALPSLCEVSASPQRLPSAVPDAAKV